MNTHTCKSVTVSIPAALLEQLDTARWPRRLNRSQAVAAAVQGWLGQHTPDRQPKASKVKNVPRVPRVPRAPAVPKMPKNPKPKNSVQVG